MAEVGGSMVSMLLTSGCSDSGIIVHCPKSPGRLPAITGMALGQSSRDGTSTTFFLPAIAGTGINFNGTNFFAKAFPQN